MDGRQRRRSGVHRGQARDRAALVAERAQLDAPWKAPDGTYFTNRLIPLRRSLPRDEKVAAQMRKLDGAIAAINLKSAKPPPPAEPGRPFYVGDAKCAGATRPRRPSGGKPCTRRRGKRWSTGASRTTTSASAATSPATARWAAAASGTPIACATCSARPATAPDRSTSPRRGRKTRPPSTGRRRPAPARSATPSSTLTLPV